ncbi:fungal-specific transcription factor domain-containing protein [Rhizophagus clarus]|uniref:Fungal-specific transcription factor domain-containing protein n=1 Tax=Rhizophagus clarus TaxID=94130 RepID=A0A8H3ME09_9GLOM|nr:fungal-specific transcription factor domain-containing protein [Rhizophagus clarus]
MKIKYGVFLFFIISTYSNLIPNNRVIPDSGSTKDFNLIEGITYKIVHSKSSANLDSEGDGVYTSSKTNPYQYWSLRKADGNRYNIINLETGMNLDSNGKTAYISVPEHNSISNPYQHWMFKKIDNDTYNIIHSESQNLDGNGNDVYIKGKSLSTLSRVNLLSGNFVFENYANVTIEQTIDRIEKKSNTYTLEIKKSESFQNTISIYFRSVFDIPILKDLGIKTEFTITDGIEYTFRSKYEKVYKESVSETVSYRIYQKITVPPLNSVKVNSTIDKTSIHIPFKAKIRINGKADRLDENGRVISMTDVEINALRCYLQKENYESKNITVEGNTLIIDTSGTLEVEGYGFDTRVETYPIIQNPKNPPSNFPFLFILYIAFAIFTPFIAYCLIKLYLNRRNESDGYIRIS